VDREGEPAEAGAEILLEDPALSYHAAHKVTEQDTFDNRLIFGDNLLALKALQSESEGMVRCAYADLPFNTGEAFEHYDDALEHSIWLSLVRDRLAITRELLAEDGTLFLHIDDNEIGYLIAMADELFGRKNRIAVIPSSRAQFRARKPSTRGSSLTCNYLL